MLGTVLRKLSKGLGSYSCNSHYFEVVELTSVTPTIKWRNNINASNGVD
ncbi:hypothetical protein SAMN02982997_01378 [Legionella micdadei]|uniref:Uncharacterized protein n=1 Tax=Legionella micdadei TaxID=451 RepID=A0A1G5EYS4_LEGMI|nr:hypothetical protein SAMN02982997_01378 [Legionella micdadei]